MNRDDKKTIGTGPFYRLALTREPTKVGWLVVFK
jgi:hypothetical protein